MISSISIFYLLFEIALIDVDNSFYKLGIDINIIGNIFVEKYLLVLFAQLSQMFPWKQLNILKFPYLLIGADDDR